MLSDSQKSTYTNGQFKSSVGSKSLHLMDEAAYLNPERASTNFETRENHKKIENGIKHYDLIVIGGGGGISKISTPSAKKGYRVAYIERARNGGTCLNRGCIPSKMLIHTAEIADTMRFSDKFDLTPPAVIEHNFQATVDYVAKSIDEDSFSIDGACKRREGVDWYHSNAEFIGPKLVKVDGDKITADRIFIAAGTRPFIPNIPGLSETPYITSTEALRLDEKPKSMVILGGGFIASELAFYFGALGVDIVPMVRSSLIRPADRDVSAEFSRIFTKRFPKTQLGTSPTSISHNGTEFTIKTNKGEEVVAESLLVATGVVPNTDLLGLTQENNFGISLNKKGYIEVDDCLKTKIPGVWAFGDVIGRYLFRHNANWEGEYLFRNIMYKESQSTGGIGSLLGKENYPVINYHGMPSAVFCGKDMQNAAVGETEQALEKRGANFISIKREMKRSAYGMALRADSGFVKLLVERGTRKILGCHIIGDQASVLMHQVSMLFHMPGGPLLDYLVDMIYIHPSLSEIIRNTARMARDELVKLGDDVPETILFK